MSRIPQPGKHRITVVALAAVAAAATLLLLVQARRQGQLAGELAAARERIRQLDERAAEMAADNQALRARLVELGETPPPAPALPRRPEAGSTVEQARLLVKLQQELSSTENALREAETRLREFEEKFTRAAEDAKWSAALLEEYKEKLAGQSRVLEALQAELKTRNERLVQLETANLLLHKQNRQAEDESARQRALLRELEEINRRRENTLVAVMRRYRELADQFRALAVQPAGPGEAGATQASELSRVQSALAMTEDDLRQLTSLNAQAARLQRQLERR